MFLRTKVVRHGDRTYTYAQVVTSYRDARGRTRQRVVRSLGNLAHLDAEYLDRVTEALRAGDPVPPASDARPVLAPPAPPADPDDTTVLESRSFGDVFVVRQAWESLGLGPLFRELASGARVGAATLANAVFTMVANRAICPKSKLATIAWAQRDVFLPEAHGLNEDHLYGTLGWLSRAKAQAEPEIFERVVSPRSNELQIVLYDTSACHFETEAGPALAQHGRPGRYPPGKKIVLVALVTTFDGWPIYHHVFPGATADSATVKPILRDLRRRFAIGRVVVLADNGMVNEKTLALLDRLRFDYLVAVKLRRTKEVRDVVLGRAGRYRDVDPNLRVKEVLVGKRRFVVCHNPDEAVRDRARRESILGDLRKKLASGVSWTSQGGAKLRTNGAYRRYLAPGRGPEKGLLTISAARVKKDARYDGKWVVLSSRGDLTPEDVACLYKCEGAIERDWRDLKSIVGLRPVRHWVDDNVRGHVFVCVLAKLVLREIQRRLDRVFIGIGSPAAAIQELGRIPVVELETRAGRRWERARLTQPQEELLEALGIDPASVPRRIAPDGGAAKVARAPQGSLFGVAAHSLGSAGSAGDG